MEVKIVSRHLRIAPSKLRRLFPQFDQVNLEEAIVRAKILPGFGNTFIQKVLLQGKSIAKDREMNLDQTRVKCLMANKGMSLKRRRYQSRGRVNAIMKRFSHLTIVFTDEVENKLEKTKLKPNTKTTETKKDQNGSKS